MSLFFGLSVATLLVLASSDLLADESAEAGINEPPPALMVTGSTHGTDAVAGYGDVTAFGGPSSVGAQIKTDDQRKKTPWRFKGFTRFLQPYYDFKDRTNKDYGLAFGADYNFLYQRASDSLGENTAAGGIFRLFSNWTLVGKESGNTGSLVAKIENRHRGWTDIPPQNMAHEVGYVGLTAIVFSDAGTILTNLYWDQSFNSDRLAFIAGIVDTTDYVDLYALADPWTNFSNLSFSTNPTIPIPNQGMGAAVRIYFAENYYLLAGLADANGDPSDPFHSIESFFGDRETFKHIELGWIESKANQYTDNVHVTLWQVDSREAANVPSGWGGTLSFSYKTSKNIVPYFRAGLSDGGGGGFLDRSLGAGFGYLLTERSDVFGFGAAWGRPSEKTYSAELDDQYTLEAFYRLQLFQHWTIYGDVQYLIDPALNPDEDQIWILGVGARISF